MRRLSGCRPPRGPRGPPFLPPHSGSSCAVASITAELGSIWRWAGLGLAVERVPGPMGLWSAGLLFQETGPEPPPRRRAASQPRAGEGKKNSSQKKKKERRAKGSKQPLKRARQSLLQRGLSCVSPWVHRGPASFCPHGGVEAQ